MERVNIQPNERDGVNFKSARFPKMKMLRGKDEWKTNQKYTYIRSSM